MELIQVILKSGKEQSIRRLHPWVFSGAIKEMSRKPAEGDVVEVLDNKNEFLALGHFQVGSIAVRIFSFEKVRIDDIFWKNKLKAAIHFRQQLGYFNNPDLNVFRLVHGEGDDMPGLIVDYYNGTAVLQAHSVGMYLLREKLALLLKQLLTDKLTAVYDKSEGTLPFKAGLDPHDSYLLGEPDQNEVLEYGNRFSIDWEQGQKTGFFIDQRENRKLLAAYSAGKKVCNVFGYTGGFSVYALKAGATLVHSVDASKQAIELTRKNVELNFGSEAPHEGFAMDAFDFFNQTQETYDVVVLDPPAFAKHQKALHNALQGYKKINQKALEQIKPGGILFTFSCSQAVSREEFRKSVFAASVNARRKVRILHQLTQPADHPISIYHPESEYLKGLVLHVE
ncbi:MAG: RlmI/RlmK family 23S rRNA methyltransferase [Bacteroidetes bacterium HGW-Bacteroidetes-4]|jgi:23S rRNA (cytosine1962-C5)-methyltransferase|nr:MAG: RlmI/RlmK family 23S rRNA methyltransferase [Bacteroidetes bacterium HGW-Bacteroidetes-4]